MKTRYLTFPPKRDGQAWGTDRWVGADGSNWGGTLRFIDRSGQHDAKLRLSTKHKSELFGLKENYLRVPTFKNVRVTNDINKTIPT